VTDDSEDAKKGIVLSRTGELQIRDKETNRLLSTSHLPYGADIFVEENQEIKKGDLICQWDPFNALIISEFSGELVFDSIEEGVTFRVERDEQTGFQEKVIIESKKRKKIPTVRIVSEEGEELKSYNLPVGAYISVDNGQKISKGSVIAKIPRQLSKVSDITGGLPRVTELFEARNPSNPAVTSEIDGVVSFGKIKRG